MRRQRHLILPGEGTLLVSTDLHGNGADFEALRAAFARELARGPTHWALLGDCVHGPDEASAREEPALYGYRDESMAIVRGILDLQARHPGRVHYLLGNHDHGHVGGHHTSRFHDDEVANLEGPLGAEDLALLHRLFDDALLAAAAPCGVLLSHGVPGEPLQGLAALDAIDPELPRDESERRILETLLWSYAQTDAVAARMLQRLSRPGLALTISVHGHDRDESGFVSEGAHQACPVLFGAPRAAKRYLRLDLAARYQSVRDLREGVEILHLHSQSQNG